jgi:hypothetical protein
VTAYYHLGCVYWELLRWPEVVRAWEKCLEIKPDYPNIAERLPQAKKWAATINNEQ